MGNGFNGLSSNGRNNIVHEIVIFFKNVATINSSYMDQKKKKIKAHMVVYKSLKSSQQN